MFGMVSCDAFYRADQVALIQNKYLYICNHLSEIHTARSCIIGVSFPEAVCVDSSPYYVIQTSQTGHVSYSSVSIGSA